MAKSTLIYICDDDLEFCRIMEKKIYNLFRSSYLEYECMVQIFDSAAALLNAWNERKADVVFLDICMPEIDGFQASEKIRSQRDDAIIIYVTNHDDMVYQVWDFKPFWFVRKSKMKDVDYFFPKLIKELKIREEKKKGYKRLITEQEVVEIDMNLVMYIESQNHDIIIYYRDGKTLQSRCRISDVEEQLTACYFGRIQQGIVVNYRFISKINSREVIFLNGEKVNISRKRLADVRTQYQEFLRRK